MAARSQPASVWPARISTPPSTACKGKMWPGCTKSLATAPGATAACTVRARSAAEIPVVTPSEASMEAVKAVPFLSPLRAVMGGSCSSSQRARVSVRQIRPRPKRAMKLMAWSVTWSAASTRSPSFSRSSSSTKMTILPARMSATMSSTGEMATGSRVGVEAGMGATFANSGGNSGGISPARGGWAIIAALVGATGGAT